MVCALGRVSVLLLGASFAAMSITASATADPATSSEGTAHGRYIDRTSDVELLHRFYKAIAENDEKTFRSFLASAAIWRPWGGASGGPVHLNLVRSWVLDCSSGKIDRIGGRIDKPDSYLLTSGCGIVVTVENGKIAKVSAIDRSAPPAPPAPPVPSSITRP